MERHANYTLIGAATIVGVVLMFLFALWIARASLNRQYNTYDVVFEGPARGIGAGTEVRFNGIRVGEVSDLFMPRGQENQVVARIRIGASWPVRQDSEARLEPIGLTGLNLIQITPGTEGSPLLEQRMGEPPPPIPARQGAIDELLENSEDIARNAAEALAGARDILSEENAQRINAILTNLEEISRQLAAERGTLTQVSRAATEVAQAGREFSQAADEVGAFAADARGTLQSLDRSVAEALASIESAADSIDAAAGEAAYATLPELAATSTNLRDLTVTLERVASSIERSSTLASIGERKPTVDVAP
jgi:phospholipid/cholesterol/gamma-HCH transport system substrate-binding protein